LTEPPKTAKLQTMEVVSGASTHLMGPKSGPKTYTVAFATTMSIILELAEKII
jgi:hypothetical protein